MWDHDYGHSSGGWLWMSLLMLLMIALTAVVVMVLLRTYGSRDTGRTEGRQQGSAEAERLLDERLALGEIDADDYRTRRDLLRRSG